MSRLHNYGYQVCSVRNVISNSFGQSQFKVKEQEMPSNRYFKKDSKVVKLVLNYQTVRLILIGE